MKYFSAFLLILLIADSEIAWAQQGQPDWEIDSLVRLLPSLQGEKKLEAMLRTGKACRGLDKDRAILFFRSGLTYADSLHDKSWQSVFFRELGRMHRNASLYDSALFCFRESLALATDAGNNISIALSCNDLGIIYQQRGKLPEALQYYLQALKLQKKGVTVIWWGMPTIISDLFIKARRILTARSNTLKRACRYAKTSITLKKLPGQSIISASR